MTEAHVKKLEHPKGIKRELKFLGPPYMRIDGFSQGTDLTVSHLLQAINPWRANTLSKRLIGLERKSVKQKHHSSKIAEIVQSFIGEDCQSQKACRSY